MQDTGYDPIAPTWKEGMLPINTNPACSTLSVDFVSFQLYRLIEPPSGNDPASSVYKTEPHPVKALKAYVDGQGIEP